MHSLIHTFLYSRTYLVEGSRKQNNSSAIKAFYPPPRAQWQKELFSVRLKMAGNGF